MKPHRKRCACGRELLPPDGSPIIEGLSTVDRLRHTLGSCDQYRMMQRRAPLEPGTKFSEN